MSFPASPTSGQTTTTNGIIYQYNSTLTAWLRVVNLVYTATSMTLVGTAVSTSTTTGALVVAGGAGVGGNLNVGGTISTPNTFGFKNRIINGAMVIDQRFSGTTATNTYTGYVVDRWNVVQSITGKLTSQQNAGSVTPPAGFTNYLGVVSQSAYSVLSTDYYIIQQPIEAANISDLAYGTAGAKTTTLSFWVYSSLTGTFGGSLLNSNATRSYPFSYTVSNANTWTQISITVSGDTSGSVGAGNIAGLTIRFCLGGGTSQLGGTANTWNSSGILAPTGSTSVVGTSGATFYITGVQFEVGSQATSFDVRDYGRELMMCQRYFLSAYNVTGVWGGTAVQGMFNVPVSMRTTPTITLNGNLNWADTINPGFPATSFGFGLSTPTNVASSNVTWWFGANGSSSLTQYRVYFLSNYPSGPAYPLLISAEL